MDQKFIKERVLFMSKMTCQASGDVFAALLWVSSGEKAQKGRRVQCRVTDDLWPPTLHSANKVGVKKKKWNHHNGLKNEW